jgi:hypothetical protein
VQTSAAFVGLSVRCAGYVVAGTMLVALASPVAAQTEHLDRQTLDRIRDEGFQHSHVMEVASCDASSAITINVTPFTLTMEEVMYAVFRETHYAAGRDVVGTSEYQAFDTAHAAQPGYRGTLVADAGDGRLLTVTLWATAEAMAAARDALGPVIARSLNPLMTAPAVLLGTGQVVVNDLAPG